MSINRQPTIEYYWSSDDFVVNQTLSDIMTRFKDILCNVQFLDNTTADRNDRVTKVCPLIDYFNKVFPKAMPNSSQQSIDDTWLNSKEDPVGSNIWNISQYNGDLNFGSGAIAKLVTYMMR